MRNAYMARIAAGCLGGLLAGGLLWLANGLVTGDWRLWIMK